MKRVNKEFLAEKKLWLKALANETARFGDCVIGVNDVIDAYFSLVDFLFQAGFALKVTGGIGAINGQRLVSAVSRQKDVVSRKPKWKTDYEKCATLFYGLIKTRPFQNLNSSTALLGMLFYLSKIGRAPMVHHKELEIITRIIASNEIRQRGAFEPYSSFEDGEIVFLANYFQENTCPVDKGEIDGLEPRGDGCRQGTVFNSDQQLPSLIRTYFCVFQRIVKDDEKRSQELEPKSCLAAYDNR